MKLPYSWLKELSGVDWTPEEMARRLTASGTAGEAHIPDPAHFHKVVVGRTITVEDHPQADKLKVVTVDTGEGTRNVVCGAPNCEEGQKVVVALPGARLQGQYEIKPTKLRGVESFGMICAEDELGLSDDHSGIIILDEDAPVGEPIYEYLGLGDPVIDFEITPNRPDCLSALGVAREICALAGKPLTFEWPRLNESREKTDDFIKVRVDDSEGCPRYTARIIKDIKVGPSPRWMQKRLIDCGVRPINNIVDITNYVMLEVNQPLHAFDYDRFGSTEVVVRKAGAGERFTTLDGNQHIVDDTVLLITNGREAVAAGGVMGGLESEVTESTTTVLLEAAYFDPAVIRRSARMLGLSSESSYRFERGIDPNNVARASARAAAFMAEYAGGTVLAGVADAYVKRIEPVEVSLRPQQARRLLGADITDDFMMSSLRGLGLEVTPDEIIKVVVPTFRPDLTREVDLIEEIGRIYGLDKIPVTKSNAGPLFAPTHVRDTIKNQIREILTGMGFDETLSSGFAHPGRLALIDPDLKPIEITNPISEDFSFLRPRLLYSLLTSAGHNIRHRTMDFKIFEIGRIYVRGESAFAEPTQVGLFMTGRTDRSYWKSTSSPVDLHDLKGALSTLLEALNIDSAVFKPEIMAGYNRGLAYDIHVGGLRIGRAGLVDKRVCLEFDIKQEGFAAELDIASLIDLRKELKPFTILPKFPASGRDIAVIVDNAVPAGDIQNEITQTGGDLVESVTVFDMFTGGPVPPGRKSLAFSISFRSTQKTLEDEEIDALYEKIVARLEQRFEARLRE